MRQRAANIFLIAMVLAALVATIGQATTYEVSKDERVDVQHLQSTDVALYGVKLGDHESKAKQILLNEGTPGVRSEYYIAYSGGFEYPFILIWDKRGSQRPMAGIRMFEGKVDLIFLNQSFGKWARGVFRTIFENKHPLEVRELVDSLYAAGGFDIYYLSGEVNIVITVPAGMGPPIDE